MERSDTKTLGTLVHFRHFSSLVFRVLEGAVEETADGLRIKKGGLLRHREAASANTFDVINGNIFGNNGHLRLLVDNFGHTIREIPFIFNAA